jgi:hypothetical protein
MEAKVRRLVAFAWYEGKKKLKYGIAKIIENAQTTLIALAE